MSELMKMDEELHDVRVVDQFYWDLFVDVEPLKLGEFAKTLESGCQAPIPSHLVQCCLHRAQLLTCQHYY
jgi:hypothetical protein